MKFTRMPEDAFKKLQLNAGVLLNEFDPSSAVVDNSAILGATSGGTNFTATPTFKDFGEDIDNCPKNVKELKKIESWDVAMSGNFITLDSNIAKTLIAAADVDADGVKVTPRNDLKEEDFKDFWWVGDYSDENGEDNGGFVAIHLMNALSTGGFSLKSGDRAKGQYSYTLTGHYSLNEQNKVPFEIYVKPGASA